MRTSSPTMLSPTCFKDPESEGEQKVFKEKFDELSKRICFRISKKRIYPKSGHTITPNARATVSWSSRPATSPKKNLMIRCLIPLPDSPVSVTPSRSRSGCQGKCSFPVTPMPPSAAGHWMRLTNSASTPPWPSFLVSSRLPAPPQKRSQSTDSNNQREPHPPGTGAFPDYAHIAPRLLELEVARRLRFGNRYKSYPY